MKDLIPFIQDYKNQREDIREKEVYKWKAFKHFRENCYNKDYNSIEEWIRVVFSKAGNLLSSSNYLPLGMLTDFSNNDGEPTYLQELFEDLLVAGVVPTPQSVRSFINGTKEIMQTMASRGYKDWYGRKNLNSYQDVHAVSVYISMFYPNDFYIYKFSVFQDFAKIVGHTIEKRNAVDRLFEFQELCHIVKAELKKDVDLIEEYKEWLNSSDYEDDALCLLTQDFIYAVARHLNPESFRKVKGNQPRIRSCREILVSDIKYSIAETHKQRKYEGVKGADYEKNNRQNRKIGKSGELWVINAEKERLKDLNLNANLLEYVARDKGDGCGYDIKSVEDDGITPRYIEVKTTAGSLSQSIYFTNNEMAFSKDYKDNYYLYRVYNFKSADRPADLLIVKGGLDEIYAEPVLYRANFVIN